MPSFSKTLLQKVLWVKLQSWLKYINGEGGRQYRLAKKPTAIDILEHYSAGWIFPILTLEFEDELQISTPYALERDSRVVKIAYSDPEFYKTVFAAIDRGTDKAHWPQSLTSWTINENDI